MGVRWQPEFSEFFLMWTFFFKLKFLKNLFSLEEDLVLNVGHCVLAMNLAHKWQKQTNKVTKSKQLLEELDWITADRTWFKNQYEKFANLDPFFHKVYQK